jgi:predicted CoA-binding protein
MKKTELTLVFGASLKENRYSNIAIHRLRQYGYTCIGVGLRKGTVADVEIVDFDSKINNIHTVTMYMNAKRQLAYIDQILSYNPKRIIFNPGAENPTLFKHAKRLNIEVENACTLVLLATDAY